VRFLRRLLEHFRSPAHAAEALGFTVTHMGLLAVLYLIVAAPVMASNLGALRP
jgi:hypothetical protein